MSLRVVTSVTVKGAGSCDVRGLYLHISHLPRESRARVEFWYAVDDAVDQVSFVIIRASCLRGNVPCALRYFSLQSGSGTGYSIAVLVLQSHGDRAAAQLSTPVVFQ